MTSEEHVSAGRIALQSGRWEEARDAFEAALDQAETPEALDGMGEALWWLCDARSSVRFRERAYVGFRRAGDTTRACLTALSLSTSYLVNLGNEAAARGWLGRAEGVMRRADPNPMQGWLWAIGGYLSEDPHRSRELLGRALDFARESGDVDLELMTLGDLGLDLVVEGEVEEGMAMLDEAMAGTLGGEYESLQTVVFTSCSMLAACSLAGDLERAMQWCRVADEFMKDYGCPFLYARCRVHYGDVLVAKGHWEHAENELQAALDMSEDAGPGPKEEALARLADLRFRQGRLEEAEALLAVLDDGANGGLPAAEIRLARGEPQVAVALLRRRLKQLGERHIEVPQVLAMLVEAHIASGDLDAAAAAASRLLQVAHAGARPHAAALSTLASAHISIAKDQSAEAVGQLESALEQFSQLDLPLETARARCQLAAALVDEQPELAVAEAASALAAFEELGATADADSAAALLRSLGASRRVGHR
ncbi:MAG: helix-turn-helix transcriptional regulator, partial [Actinomycetota bacterium]|nr:helix-turn-helix transcriptional regulator [Actinomycetota bacterium]